MTDTGDWSAVLDVWEADLAVRRQLAEAATPGPWEWEPEASDDGWNDRGPNLVTVAKKPPYRDGSVGAESYIVTAWGYDAWGICVEDADAAHIARHDPASVLADIATQQATITMLRGVLERHRPHDTNGMEPLAPEGVHCFAHAKLVPIDKCPDLAGAVAVIERYCSQTPLSTSSDPS